MNRILVSLLSGIICATLGAAGAAVAVEIDVLVVAPDGRPVQDVAVFADRGGTTRSTSETRPTAVMDQIGTEFVPHMLVIETGTAVRFPNSDTTAHHVYSFSKPNNFVLPLYKGNPHEPVVFDHDGVVTLGCNIHDHMIGYIVVVDSHAFGVTDASGKLRIEFDSPADAADIRIWSPRIRDDEAALTKTISTSTGGHVEVTFALKKRLRARHGDHSEAIAWSEY